MTKASTDVAAGANQFGVSSGLGEPSRPEPFCGDIDMRIDRQGTWHYGGSPIGRRELVKLFASVLRRDEAGDYWLVTPVERARIRVEDAPFVAVELAVEGGGRDQTLRLRTNLDEVVAAGPDHPIRVVHDIARGEPRPYILIRPGLEALINRAVYYHLVEIGVEEAMAGGRLWGVWSAGRFFPLGTPEG